jgi:Zn-dependent protease with chaperone function
MHAANVLGIGWLGAVRGVVGDVVAVDELIAVLPPIGVFVAGWWAYYPIDAAMHDAVRFRMLETSRTVYPPVSRWRFVVLNVRHQVLLVLVPIGMILAWGESVRWVVTGLVGQARGDGVAAVAGRWLMDADRRGWAEGVLQLVGVAVVFVLSPLVLRGVWDTVRLGPGPIRERLLEVCRGSGVKVRELLVWRTYGTMLNGAVIGLVGPLRYILLTDALLDRLPQRQVEAVMAHEVGHARHAHMPWLAASMLAGVSGAALLLSVGVWGVVEVAWVMGRGRFAEAVAGSGLVTGGLLAGSFALGMVWFGFVSRRFEWQADAFAARRLSEMGPAVEPTLWDVPGGRADGDKGVVVERSPLRVQAEAVWAMTGALESVAEASGLERTRRSWRHGSIEHRQARLRKLVGRPVDELPIDRVARWLKRVVVVGIVGLMGLAVAQEWVMGGMPS